MRLIDADALTIDMVIEEAETPLMPWYPSHMSMRKTDGVSIEQINNSPTIDAVLHWIPCEERLPEYLDYVLLSSPEYGLKIGARSRKSNFNSWYLNEPLDCDVWHVILSDPWYDFEDFTAWMPLPEPYEGERKDDE